MKKNKRLQVLIKVMGMALFVLVVAGLLSATDAGRKGKVTKIMVNIYPLAGDILLINNDDLARDFNTAFKEKLKAQIIEDLDLTKIEGVIEKNVFVKDAEVYIDARNNLRINVRQKNPVIRVFDQKGNTFYIDDNGNKVPKSMKAVLRLPVLTGAIPEYRIALSRDKASPYYHALKIVEAIGQNPFMAALTEQLVVADNKDIAIIPKLGKHKIVLGNSNDTKEKFKKLELFYKQGMQPAGWEIYSEINLKYKDQVVAKKTAQLPIKS